MAEAGLRGWLLWALLLQVVSLLPCPAPHCPHWGWRGLLGDSEEGLGLAPGLWRDGAPQIAQKEGVGEGSGLPASRLWG